MNLLSSWRPSNSSRNKSQFSQDISTNSSPRLGEGRFPPLIRSVGRLMSVFLVYGVVFTQRFPQSAPGIFKYVEIVCTIALTGLPFARHEIENPPPGWSSEFPLGTTHPRGSSHAHLCRTLALGVILFNVFFLIYYDYSNSSITGFIYYFTYFQVYNVMFTT